MRACLTEIVTIFGRDCCTVAGAARHILVQRSSHSDDFHNVPERIGLDTNSDSFPDADDNLMLQP